MEEPGASTQEEIIRYIDVHKWFDDFHVLKGITTTIHKGEVVVVFGPSGSGKSTCDMNSKVMRGTPRTTSMKLTQVA